MHSNFKVTSKFYSYSFSQLWILNVSHFVRGVVSFLLYIGITLILCIFRLHMFDFLLIPAVRVNFKKHINTFRNRYKCYETFIDAKCGLGSGKWQFSQRYRYVYQFGYMNVHFNSFRSYFQIVELILYIDETIVSNSMINLTIIATTTVFWIFISQFCQCSWRQRREHTMNFYSCNCVVTACLIVACRREIYIIIYSSSSASPRSKEAAIMKVDETYF